MIEDPPLLTIRKNFDRVPKEAIAELDGAQTGHIVDAMRGRGAMDGAMKFVKGDAIAGILITIINIVGGLLIGVHQMGLPAKEAAAIYSQLTIGDGLVSQIPALLISVAAGIVVTRVASR